MHDPYYVEVASGDYRAVTAALRAWQAGRLQGLRFWVAQRGGPVEGAYGWLQPWDAEDDAYWLRATRGDYGGLDAIVGYSHRDASWTEA